MSLDMSQNWVGLCDNFLVKRPYICYISIKSSQWETKSCAHLHELRIRCSLKTFPQNLHLDVIKKRLFRNCLEIKLRNLISDEGICECTSLIKTLFHFAFTKSLNLKIVWF